MTARREEQFATRMADALEELILREGPDTCGAFIAEPVMGAGGGLTPPRTYWEKMQAVIRKYDMLFIADEVICGFGRTGNMWGSADLRSAARHDLLRQGAVGRDAADLRAADQPARVRGDAG